jgi:hypothetical protein
MTKRFIKDCIYEIHDELKAVVDALAVADPLAARKTMEVYMRNSGHRVAGLLHLADVDA